MHTITMREQRHADAQGVERPKGPAASLAQRLTRRAKGQR